MYNELIKALRETDFSDGCPCGAEPMCKDKDCVILQAADAIEELSKLAEVNAKRVLKWAFDAEKAEEKLRWIPVTEQLPEEWWPVLGLIQYHDEKEPPSQQVLWYLGNGHWRETWRGDMIESDVTHWMPLPSTDGLNET